MPPLALSLIQFGFVSIFLATPLSAQELPDTSSQLRPLNQQELDRRESLQLYAKGILLQREDHLADAADAFASALRLDPQSVPILKAMIPLNHALERDQEAIALTKKVLELAPDDAVCWHYHGRQLRALGKNAEAIKALERALECEWLIKDAPLLAQQVYHDLGALHEVAQEPAKAVKAFREAASLLELLEAHVEGVMLRSEDIKLRCGEAYLRLGQNAFQVKDYDEAISAFRKAQEKNPRGGAPLDLNIALALIEKKDPAQAIVHLDAYLRLMPQATEPYNLKIKLLRQLKKEGAILPWLESASKGDQFNLGLKLLLARELSSAGQREKAETIYQDEIRQAPSPALYAGLFALYQQDARGGAERVLTLLDQTMSLAEKKGDPKASAAQGQVRAMLTLLRDEKDLALKIIDEGLKSLERKRALCNDTRQFLGALSGKHRQHADAEKFYRASLVDLPTDDAPRVHAALLSNLWSQRKHVEVAELCQSLLPKAKEIERVSLHANLARALASQGKTEAAGAEVDKAIAISENGQKLVLSLLRVRLLIQEDKLASAREECQKLLKDHPLPSEQLEVRYLLATIYTQQKQQPKAEEELAECLKIDPNNATINNDLGYIWADQNKKLDEAEVLIRKALEADRKLRTSKLPFEPMAENNDEDNAAYVDSLGWVLFRRGKLQEARVELERACKLPDGDDPVLWDHLGDVYRALEMNELAVDAWRHSLQLCDSDKRRKMEEKKRELKVKIETVSAGR